MNIQQIINNAATRMKEPAIASVANSASEQSMAYLGSANKVAKSIAVMYNWSNIIIDHEFNTVAGLKDYPLPTDYERLNSTYLYNIDNNLYITSEDADRALASEASKTTTWTSARYRLVRDNISFTVPADQVNKIKFSYVSKDIVKETDGGISYKNIFEKNSDEFLLDDELLTIGIVIDLKQQYGFNYELDLNEFNKRFSMLTENDKGGYILSDSDTYRPSPFQYPNDYQPVCNGGI
ncbi:MAG: hypothetical protein Unbinned6284contig1004_58 [Prokaryotic dsDNA virus sp.]|nr:MAG: hypothetical protein Unbinned6284contig1004_58 [Prokaryotic dsDNA virus sp.]|tara:strand:+ start:16236 stop:16946 length:711 start_codon:yes stop_codon:yes gene_type:complete